LSFIDADDLHPPANVEKMSRGEPLTDADRGPWLERVREVAAAAAHITADSAPSADGDEERAAEHPPHDDSCPSPHPLPGHPRTLPPAPDIIAHPSDAETGGGCVVACSALKRAYREVLRSGPLRAVFVHPHGAREVLLSRMSARKGHFMKADMLDSQLATLEDPLGEEGVVRVPVEAEMGEQVEVVLEGLEGMDVAQRA
jgi:gluconokinase